jgi:NADH:ubiquinone oxidoreductase subunit 5 (subunit L)/multisubunit Na+/H+ antiporter MnhA subunit
MRIPEEGGLRKVGLQRWYDSAAQLYHIDEFYQDTLVRGTMASSEGLGRFDDAVVDGIMVNGSAWAAVQFSKFSDWFDRRVVDGLVRAVAWLSYEMGEMLRDVQQGVVQIYALVVFASIFALVVVLQYLR